MSRKTSGTSSSSHLSIPKKISYNTLNLLQGGGGGGGDIVESK